MKLYYFYSETYLFYHEHIQERLSEHMELMPLVIDDIPEVAKGRHHFTGLTLKLELCIDAISQNMGEQIVFSDATIFVHSKNASKLREYLERYREYDLVFIKEGKTHNIGFITMHCNEHTLAFFKQAYELIHTKKIEHDQGAINTLLLNPSTKISFTNYDHRIYCDGFIPKWREEFIIWKSFITNRNKKDNFNQRIQKFYKHDLIDKPTFDKWHLAEMDVFNGQASQDEFVLLMHNKKRDGYFLEIGSNHPIHINNTFVLERNYGWKGLLVEMEPAWEPMYKEHRISPYIIQDATTVDYLSLFRKYEFPKQMDYLQIDLEVSNESTMQVLEHLDATIFPEYTFSTVTFEHDIYTGNHYNTRERSRAIFERNGYELLFPNVSNGGLRYQFEDWYIYPSAFPEDFLSKLRHGAETMEHRDIIDRILLYRSR